MDLPPLPSIDTSGPIRSVLNSIVQYLFRLYRTLMGLEVTSDSRTITIVAADQFGNVNFPQIDDPSRIVFWELFGAPVGEADTYLGVTVTPVYIPDPSTGIPNPLVTYFFIQKPVTSDDKTYTITVYYRAR